MSQHLDDDALVAFLLHEDSEEDADRCAEHVIACGECAARLDRLAEVERSLAELRALAHAPIQTRGAVEAMEARGLVTRHALGVDGAVVRGDIAPEVDIVVMHLPVPPTSTGLQVHLCGPDGTRFRTLDAPAGDDEVFLCCHRVVAVMNPWFRVQVEAAGALVLDTTFQSIVASQVEDPSK